MSSTMLGNQPPDLLSTFEASPIPFGKWYFPHHIRDVSPWFHWKLMKESSSDDGNRFFACIAPRGSAKSTVLSFLKVTHRIAFKKKKFIVIVQSTYKKAVGTLEGIKDEIRYNEKFKADFGIVLEKDAEGDTIFRHRDGTRIRVLCKGAEQIGGVRGEKFGAYRPDYILIDDLEDDEGVKNPERRAFLKELYDNALIPAGDAHNLCVDFIGTLLHDDSLAAKIIGLGGISGEYAEYRRLFFKALSKNTKTGEEESLWPERWTVQELKKLERDKPEVFAKEYQGDPSSGSLETIRREDFRYWRTEEGQAVLYGADGEVVSRWKLLDCRAAVGIDLAWESKQASDFSAIIPGFITPANDMLVDDYICKKGLRPDEFEEIVFSMNERYEKLTGKRVQFGFEKASLEKVMKWFLQESMKRRGRFLWFKDIVWGTQDKVARIMFRIANRYSQHSVYHKRGMGDLENQLIRLKSAAHDDLCLVGNTLILTDKGQVPLVDIKVGDKVLTRNGFRKVLNKECTGLKNIINNLGIGLTGTSNHPVITKYGIKYLEDVHVDDILYIWNEKLLNIEEKSITDIQNQKEDSIESISGDMTNGKPHLLHCIDKYTLMCMDQFQKVLLFITSMRIHLITNLRIWLLCHDLNICDSIQVSHIESKELKILLSEQFIQKKENKKQENGIKVQKDINGTLKMPVYNLKIEIDNEYFANNILVHNCDALGMLPEMLYYSSSVAKPKDPEDRFMEMRKHTPLYRERNKSKYIFGSKSRPLPFKVVNAI